MALPGVNGRDYAATRMFITELLPLKGIDETLHAPVYFVLMLTNQYIKTE